MSTRSNRVIAVANLQEFFRESLHSAMSHQGLEVRDHTEHYVVNLLTLFSRAEALYDAHDGEGPNERSQRERSGLKPLVMMLAEALEAPTLTERNRGLQRLGDVSLFVAGFFAGSFARKLVDIDYHIAMGGRAYGSLADLLSGSRGQALGGVFAELAAKFQRMVDALNEVSEMAYTHTDRDILRLYEIWMKTGSRRAGEILRRLGVEPAPDACKALQH
jgi:hypothetical protein